MQTAHNKSVGFLSRLTQAAVIPYQGLLVSSFGAAGEPCTSVHHPGRKGLFPGSSQSRTRGGKCFITVAGLLKHLVPPPPGDHHPGRTEISGPCIHPETSLQFRSKAQTPRRRLWGPPCTHQPLHSAPSGEHSQLPMCLSAGDTGLSVDGESPGPQGGEAQGDRTTCLLNRPHPQAAASWGALQKQPAWRFSTSFYPVRDLNPSVRGL